MNNLVSKFKNKSFGRKNKMIGFLLRTNMKIYVVSDEKSDEEIRELLECQKFKKLGNFDDNYDVYIDEDGLRYEKPLNLLSYSILKTSFYGNVLCLKKGGKI